MQTKELEPCPFCGSAVNLQSYETDAEGTRKWVVGCDCRDAPEDEPGRERYVSAHGVTEVEAITAWNTRHPTSSGDRGEAWRPDREAVARIIDPHAWNLWREDDRRHLRSDAEAGRRKVRADSLAKADAILALAPENVQGEA